MSERAQREDKIFQFWKENKIFEKTLEKSAPKGEFVFYDGPPFATGLPHYGSLLSSIIKDVIPRYKTMRGFRVRRRWGCDCHGLPIENMIEKELGITNKKEIEKMGVAKFNKTCRDSVLRFADEWKISPLNLHPSAYCAGVAHRSLLAKCSGAHGVICRREAEILSADEGNARPLLPARVWSEAWLGIKKNGAPPDGSSRGKLRPGARTWRSVAGLGCPRPRKGGAPGGIRTPDLLVRSLTRRGRADGSAGGGRGRRRGLRSGARARTVRQSERCSKHRGHRALSARRWRRPTPACPPGGGKSPERPAAPGA